MVDSLTKCEQYKEAREAGTGKASVGFHEIDEAPAGSKIWRQKSASTSGGYIGKSGFCPHT